MKIKNNYLRKWVTVRNHLKQSKIRLHHFILMLKIALR